MKKSTIAIRAGGTPSPDPRFVNPPVYHASTILFEDIAALEAAGPVKAGDGLTYAVHGTPGTYALERAIAELDGGHRTRLCSAGAQALSGPLLAFLSAGDHALVPDNCYGNTRKLALDFLPRFGIAAELYDPLADPRPLIRPETRVVYTESPGSQTFEVQDIPAIAAAAHEAGAIVMMDNTWASPLYFDAFGHGVDIVIQAVTKYIAGHADLVMGAVSATEACYDRLQAGWYHLGLSASPDDAYLAMRGLRTMALRLERHWRSGVALGAWLRARPEVADVIHPAMEHDRGHAIWARDFTGAGGLFAFWLSETLSEPAPRRAFFDALELFGLGFSWGAHQSMILPVAPKRTASPWPREGAPRGQLVRIYTGLEDVGDLEGDLDRAFAAARAAA